jgi:lipopolysaccharide assembly outer membrane protein LptD (OstA)
LRSKNITYLFVTVLLVILSSVALPAQNDRRSRREARRVARAGTTVALPDSLTLDSLATLPLDSLAFRRDSLARADSLHRADSLSLLGKSSLELPAFSGARDSIVEVFTEGKRMVYYYGDVKVTYQNIELTAEYMEYDMNTGEVFATGVVDPETGEMTGTPVMTQGNDKYEMEKVRYNFNSRKARITNMTTNDNEGILHGHNIKMLPDKSINITDGQYTVCDAEEPHYYLALSSAKVITKPTQKTVFGPAHPVIEGVHIPVVLPFGFIPKKPQRATGLLMPTFGEEQSRGFYARDAGMYFVIGDYLDFSLTGDIYTLGSWAVDVNSRYKVNYKFNGNFALTYSNDQKGEKGSSDFFQSRNFSVKWSHSQDSKAHPGQTFSASVNFSSPSNGRYNSRSVNEALQNQTSSSISFTKNWNGKINLSINALGSQSSRDSSYAFTLPNVTFSVSTFYPFKKKVRVGKEKAYEKISFGYNTSLQNKVNFKASEFGQEDFNLLNKFQNGMTHNFSIGLPSFALFNYLNFNPSVSYGQNWFFKKTDYVYNPETDDVEKVEGKQFSGFGITQTYSGSISMSTRLYGMFNFGKHHRIQAIRHVVSPSVSFSVSPNLATRANGYRTLHYTDINGNEKDYDYNVYAGQMLSPPGKGRSASASFSIGNNLEAKVRDFADTSGTGSKKVKILDQLNFNSSYNFLADSLKMGNIGMTMSTTIFEKMNISANANFDPYAIDERGKKINKFNVMVDPAHPLRLTNASISTSYSWSGDGAGSGNDGSGGSSTDGYTRIYYHPVTGEYIPGGWLYYTNPNSPWSISFSYSFSYNKSYAYTNDKLTVKHNFTQTVSMNGNLKLTPKLSINATSGFDLMAMRITSTQFSASYDLHCFNIQVSWVPTGTWKSYSFRIAANASTLSDVLRFKKSSSYWDN